MKLEILECLPVLISVHTKYIRFDPIKLKKKYDLPHHIIIYEFLLIGSLSRWLMMCLISNLFHYVNCKENATSVFHACSKCNPAKWIILDDGHFTGVYIFTKCFLSPSVVHVRKWTHVEVKYVHQVVLSLTLFTEYIGIFNSILKCKTILSAYGNVQNKALTHLC